MSARGSVFSRALLFAALLAVTLAAYQPAWHGTALWDDHGHLTKPELQSAAGLRRIWLDLGATQQYYPLVHSAFWVMHRLWGDATTGYHLVSIGLHALSALLIAVLLGRLLVPGALPAAFVFALHPVQAESVAWIAELKNTLSALFYLGAALAYLRFDASRRRRDWILATGLFALALLSKTVTATLPVSLLILAWWRRGEVQWRRDARPLVPFFALAIAAGAMTTWVEHALIGARGADFSLAPIERALLAGRAVWFYLASLLWPSHLVFVYPRWPISQAVWWQYLFPATLAAALVGLWRLRARTRAPLAALLLYLAALSPALGFVNVFPFRYSFVADHFQYLASIPAIAFLTATATLVATAWIAAAATRATLACAALAPLAALTWQQSHQYADAETLYRTTIARNPSAWLAHHNLGERMLHGSAADLPQALAHIEESLRLHPENPEALNSRGFALQRMGRHDEARRDYEEALRFLPGLSAAHNNLGVLAASEGRLDEAVQRYREVLRLDPDDREAERNLAIGLLDLGRTREAEPLFRRAFERNPRDPDVLDHLGTLVLREGRLEDASRLYQDALSLWPGFARAHGNLAFALEHLGQLAEAEAHYREAVRLEPVSVRTLTDLGNALLRRGRPGEGRPTAAGSRPGTRESRRRAGGARSPRRGDRRLSPGPVVSGRGRVRGLAQLLRRRAGQVRPPARSPGGVPGGLAPEPLPPRRPRQPEARDGRLNACLGFSVSVV